MPQALPHSRKSGHMNFSKTRQKSITQHMCVHKINEKDLSSSDMMNFIDDVGRTRTYAPEGN
jgi:hypothetical protein